MCQGKVGVKKGKIYGLGLEWTILVEKPSLTLSFRKTINKMEKNVKYEWNKRKERKRKRKGLETKRDHILAKFVVYDALFQQIIE